MKHWSLTEWFRPRSQSRRALDVARGRPSRRRRRWRYYRFSTCAAGLSRGARHARHLAGRCRRPLSQPARRHAAAGAGRASACCCSAPWRWPTWWAAASVTAVIGIVCGISHAVAARRHLDRRPHGGDLFVGLSVGQGRGAGLDSAEGYAGGGLWTVLVALAFGGSALSPPRAGGVAGAWEAVAALVNTVARRTGPRTSWRSGDAAHRPAPCRGARGGRTGARGAGRCARAPSAPAPPSPARRPARRRLAHCRRGATPGRGAHGEPRRRSGAERPAVRSRAPARRRGRALLDRPARYLRRGAGQARRGFRPTCWPGRRRCAISTTPMRRCARCSASAGGCSTCCACRSPIAGRRAPSSPRCAPMPARAPPSSATPCGSPPSLRSTPRRSSASTCRMASGCRSPRWSSCSRITRQP